MDYTAGIDEIIQDIRQKKGDTARVVFVSGNFNVVHPGHLRLLQFAASCGDYLVVGVNDRHSPGTSLPEEMRLEGVRAISLVDYAFLLRTAAEVFVAKLKPAVVVKGKEHERQHNPEKAAVATYGGRLLFGSGEVWFSSMDLLRREYLEAELATIRKPTDYPKRHGFGISELKAEFVRFLGVRVVVIGDLIVDEYVECDPLGMSEEDPTIVVTPLERNMFVGGAGIVAAHAKGLGGDVRFLSVTGKDPIGKFAAQTLSEHEVESVLLEDDNRPTTHKQRFRAAGKTLLRVSHLHQREIGQELVARLLREVERSIRKTDLIIFSDFNYGCLPQPLVDAVTRLGASHGVMMVADSQASSQVSDVSRFVGMKLLTPTEREMRLALRDSTSGLVVLAEALLKKANAKNVVVTLGSEGLLIHAEDSGEYRTDRLPAFNTFPKDTAGAGDSLLTSCAMALCAGLDIWRSAYIGALAAACQVARVGNMPLSVRDLVAQIDQL